MSTTAIIITAIVLAAIAAALVVYLGEKKGSKEQSNEPVAQQPSQEDGTPPAQDGEAGEATSGASPVSLAEKTLTDLAPRFAEGDTITDGQRKVTVTEVRKVCYILDNGEKLPFNQQDRWTLCEPEPQEGFNSVSHVKDLLSFFPGGAEIGMETKTFCYLILLMDEAYDQYYEGSSAWGLPELYRKELFPYVMDHYGEESDEALAFRGLTGWMTALLLAEIRPDRRDEIMMAGYNLGAGKDTYIYKYDFRSDQNVARIVGSALYAACRGLLKPDMDAMRKELGGKKLTVGVHDLAGGFSKYRDKCFVDVSRFMPTAPGPYLDAYQDRSSVGGAPYPGAERQEDGNLTPDKRTYDLIVDHVNLYDQVYGNDAVQAIADKEAAAVHIVGDDRWVNGRSFHPVFGMSTIGVNIPVDSVIGKNIYDIGMIGSLCCKFMQEGDYYGRRRPGQTETDGVAYDGARGVLVDFDIENNDGNPAGYYDKGGNYIYGYEVKPGDYDWASRHNVYANSYPSRHSAFIACGASFLMELMPANAALILRAFNAFAMRRQLARYHWPSDTVIGRVVGGMMASIVRATSDYDAILEDALDELLGHTPDQEPEPTDDKEEINISLSYVLGGYGSCHVDAGDPSRHHYCNKECAKDRHPSIRVSQTVKFSIEGDGMTTIDGKKAGVWEPNKDYELVCKAVAEGQENIVAIYMRNENGVRILHYKMSRRGTHDDGSSGFMD